jgi:hypothetical protein
MTSAQIYKLMIYFATATLYFYRGDIVNIEPGETLGDFANKNKAVISRVFEEALNIFGYELSSEQIGKAVYAYLCLPTSLSKPPFQPSLVEVK